MVINRSEVPATLLTMGGQDEYGQDLVEPIAQKSISLTFGLYNHKQVDDIRYQDVEYTGLTSYDINDNQVIQIGEEKYKVLFVNKFGRMNQVFLRAM